MADETLQDAVETALTSDASKPASFTTDGLSVSNRNLRDLIALDKHAARKSGHRFGFGMRTMIPPEH